MARQPSSLFNQRVFCWLRYTALYLVAWSPTLWSVGYALLQTPSEDAPGNLGTDDEVPRPVSFSFIPQMLDFSPGGRVCLGLCCNLTHEVQRRLNRCHNPRLLIQHLYLPRP